MYYEVTSFFLFTVVDTASLQANRPAANPKHNPLWTSPGRYGQAPRLSGINNGFCAPQGNNLYLTDDCLCYIRHSSTSTCDYRHIFVICSISGGGNDGNKGVLLWYHVIGHIDYSMVLCIRNPSD